MAQLYEATLRPTKLELVSGWLPDRHWYRGPVGGEIQRVAACRFDDPAGEVGIEMMLVRASDGPVHHVPMTYRAAPLAGADEWLIGTMEHSVLGRRWIYDACGDPVYGAALAGAIFAGAGQAEELVEVDGRWQARPVSMTVTGSGAPGARVPTVEAVHRVVDGDPTLIRTDSVTLAVVRVVDPAAPQAPAAATLTGTWTGSPEPLLLAYAQA